ncbi:MAG: hypothetical protein WCD30_00795 [Pseudolabrys sp.]
MRTWVVASAFAVIVAGCSFYAVVGSPFAKVGPKADAPVDKVLLFSAPKNIPHASAEDLIATKLAIQPVISPDLPKVQQEKKPAPPKKQQAKTKPKPKKPVAVTGSL